LQDDFDFARFVQKTAKPLTAYCAAVTGSADAEDAAQEAYIRLHANLWRIANEQAAAAFLYRTAYRVSVDMLRTRRRYCEPERQKTQNASLSGRMERALMRLKPLDRSVVYLRAVEEYEYAEIAARFGKNEAWARKRWSLARMRLEKFYLEEKE